MQSKNENYEEIFISSFNKLNAEQKKAVETTEGPVMVIAGPGTGKTQILATRILNILRTQEIQAQNILCLTYTEAGAIAMQKRLSKFMGPDAHKIPIHTFHGLCNKIIQENPDKFSKKELRIMDDLDKIELIQELIEALPADSSLKTYQDDAQSTRRDLSMLWEFMQMEGITADEIKNWVAQSVDLESFKLLFPDLIYKRKTGDNLPGDVKKAEYEKMIAYWTKAIEGAYMLQEYKRLKQSRGLYEFSDMLEWVANKFETDSQLLLDSQEKYQYILVDEYQDTSGLQNKILMQLISYWGDNPNCFVVGDDDQSIYAFQGAKVSNMLKFEKKFSNTLTTVLLTQNYRSTQQILDTSKNLIDHNQLRLVHQIPGLSKNLEAAGENKNYPNLKPQVKFYVNEFHESVGLAIDIQNLINSGVQANEIAVLYSLNKHAKNVVSALEAKEIDYVIHRPINILDEPLIQHLLNWLEYLGLELGTPNAGEHLIYRLLLSPLYKINTFEINQLSVEIYKQKRESEEKQQVHYSWRSHIKHLIDKPIQGNLFGNPPSKALTELWQNIENWIREASFLTVPQLIAQLYSEGNYLSFALENNDMEWTLEVLQTFLSFAEKQNAKNPNMGIGDFISIIKQMQANKLNIPVEKRIGITTGVQLITAHSSKGLEFEHVFIIRANRDDWEKSESGRIPYRLKPLAQHYRAVLENTASAEEEFEERRRLFYVAMTRAKKGLSISYNQYKITESKTSEQLPSAFVEECALLESPLENTSNIPAEDLLFTKKQELARTSKPVLPFNRLDWIKNRLQNFTFSPSSLYAIHECGMKFYFNTLVRVPDVPGPATSYGTAVHNALKEWLDAWQNRKHWFNELELLHQFELEIRRLRYAFNEKQFQLRLQQGKDNLPLYYQQRSSVFKNEGLTHFEKNLSSVIEGVKISGRLDKMVFNGKNVTIVDYKTGKPANSQKKLGKPKLENSDKLPNSYWFQLGIYQLMINAQVEKNWICEKAIIDCVDKDEKGDYPQFEVRFSDDENQFLREWIKQGQLKLQNLGFLEGCGKADCYWCNFAKNTPGVLDEMEVEDLN